MTNEQKSAQAYIDNDPMAKAAYERIKQINPKWGTLENMIKWAQGNYQQRIGERQNIPAYPVIDPESGLPTKNPPAGDAPEDSIWSPKPAYPGQAVRTVIPKGTGGAPNIADFVDMISKMVGSPGGGRQSNTPDFAALLKQIAPNAFKV